MDFHLFFNFIPIIYVTILTLITCTTVFYKLKNRWPITVNCWFCNGHTKIYRESINWWCCSHCNQYNGFTKDGDYNYQIPEQHEVVRNYNSENSYCQRSDFSFHENNLCKKCNRNEELKLLKLRELESTVDVTDEQLLQFEKNFEKKFPLCLECQNNVQNVLYKQNQWLTEYKMLLFKQKSIRNIIQHQESIERFLRIILAILASVTIYFSEVWYFPLCGIILQLAACLASPKDQWKSNVYPLFGWLCLLWIEMFSTPDILEVFKINSRNNWQSVDSDTYHCFLFTLATVIGLTNLKMQFFKTNSNGSFTLKKLESSKNIISLSPSLQELTKPVKNNVRSRNLCSPVNITDTLMASASVETPIPLKPVNISNSEWNFGKSVIPSTTAPENFISCNSNSSTNLFSRTESLFSKNLNTQNSFSDSLNSLNSLSLGSRKRSNSNSPKVFETKIYGTDSSNLFSKAYNQRRSILAPPKLRSMTQTSWVAGGYWESYELGPGSTLSRSSSQSSGFGSTNSNIAREPSIVEFDQCSVLSEKCSYMRPDSQLSSRTSASTYVNGKQTDSPVGCSGTNDMISRNESSKCHLINNTSHCTGHTTIIANSAWIPALFCGSMVFNMIVLCTVLLR